MDLIINGKALILLLILIATYFTCRRISQSVTDSFVEINHQLLDSIKIITLKNGSAIQDLTKIENPKEKTIRQVILDLRAHNKSLESTINKLMTGSSSIKDKTMVDSYLVKSGKGKALTTEPAQCVAAIKRLPTFAGQQQIIAELESLYTLPEGEKGDWVTFRFKGMPVMAVIPLLNKWYFENLKAERVLLNQLTN